MDVVSSKVVVLVLLLVIKTGCGLLPLLLTKYLKRKRKQKCLNTFIGLVLCFGGGILLSTVFLHMLKEVRESLDEAVSKGVFQDTELDYPISELLICIGFLLIFLVESVVHKFFGHHNHGVPPSPQDQPTLSAGVDNKGFEDENNQTPNSVASSTTPKIANGTQLAKSSPFGGKKKDRNVYNVNNATLTSYTSFDSESLPVEIPKPALRGNFTSSTSSLVREKSFIATIRGFLIVLALSIHSLFEGMAIGLEESGSGVWQIFTAVIIHSMAIVFCIGTEMIASGLKKKTIIIYMLVLGLNSPIGVLIGLIVTLHVETASAGHLLAVGVLQGLAGGTLLYITFFEVLSREKLEKYKMTGLLGALAIMVGFTVMAVMEGTTSHTHSHGGGNAAGHLGHDHGHGHAHSGVDSLHFNPYEHDHDHHDEHGHEHSNGTDHGHEHDHHVHDGDHNHDHHEEEHDHHMHNNEHDSHDHNHGEEHDLHGHTEDLHHKDHDEEHDHDHDHANEHDHHEQLEAGHNHSTQDADNSHRDHDHLHDPHDHIHSEDNHEHIHAEQDHLHADHDNDHLHDEHDHEHDHLHDEHDYNHGEGKNDHAEHDLANLEKQPEHTHDVHQLKALMTSNDETNNAKLARLNNTTVAIEEDEDHFAHYGDYDDHHDDHDHVDDDHAHDHDHDHHREVIPDNLDKTVDQTKDDILVTNIIEDGEAFEENGQDEVEVLPPLHDEIHTAKAPKSLQ